MILLKYQLTEYSALVQNSFVQTSQIMGESNVIFLGFVSLGSGQERLTLFFAVMTTFTDAGGSGVASTIFIRLLFVDNAVDLFRCSMSARIAFNGL